MFTLEGVDLDVLHWGLWLFDLLCSLGLEVRIVVTFLERRKSWFAAIWSEFAHRLILVHSFVRRCRLLIGLTWFLEPFKRRAGTLFHSIGKFGGKMEVFLFLDFVELSLKLLDKRWSLELVFLCCSGVWFQEIIRCIINVFSAIDLFSIWWDPVGFVIVCIALWLFVSSFANLFILLPLLVQFFLSFLSLLFFSNKLSLICFVLFTLALILKLKVFVVLFSFRSILILFDKLIIVCIVFVVVCLDMLNCCLQFSFIWIFEMQ